MKAMGIREFGGNDRIERLEVPRPEPARGEVLVRVEYAGVNPVDWKIREGYLKDRLPHGFPLILGWDASGTVESTGEGASRFRPGDRVYAYCRKPTVQWGSFAEYIALDESAVASAPATLSMAQAAAIPLTGLTAWQALFDFAELGKGETVLIHAGAGGVGGIAIQLAREAGAQVITTASRRNHDYVRRLGADRVIDYTRDDFVSVLADWFPTGVDVCFDCAGGEALAKSYRVVRPNGRLVSIVQAPDEKASAERGIKAGYVFVTPNGMQLERMAKMLESGAMVPPALQELPLDQAAQALALSQSGHVTGKIVLRIA